MNKRRSLLLSLLACGMIGGALLIHGCHTQRGFDSQQAVGRWSADAGQAQKGPPRSAQQQQRPTSDAAPPGSLPSLDEEVWIIARDKKADDAAKAARDDAPGIPGTGQMITRREHDGETKNIALPLKRTDVNGDIHGHIASVNVKQQFHNPYDGKIEAVYVFPLPQNAAVNEFIMTIGERKIRGIIREREEAEQLYEQARRQGYTASLLTQERPNVFTQKVANIEPRKQIDVDIRYFHTLAYRDGWYEFTFPMVVAPRYNPPGQTDGIGAVGRGSTSGGSGQETEVQYLKPGERTNHRVHLSVDLHAGVPIEQVQAPSHSDAADITAHDDNERVTVSLGEEGVRADRDFTMRWRVAGDQIKANLLTYQPGASGDGQNASGAGYFALMLYPPNELHELERRPLEMVFVLDCSGSMSGKPMAQSKAAVDYALGQLTPRDTFQVIRFSNDASTFGPDPVRATAQNVQRARNYVRNLAGGGGTEMVTGLKTALEFDHDPERLRFVVFLTDGHIGNEKRILGALHDKLGASRVFSFGVGESTNRYLMNRMAKLGRGAVAYLPLEADATKVMTRFYERVRRPALTDLAIDWGDWDVTDVQPTHPPDLFVGRSVVLTGRIKNGMADNESNVVRIHGTAGERELTVNVRTERDRMANAASALPAVWARQRIAELYDRATYQDNPELPQAIEQIALDHNLMSAYTAFIAVDASRRTEGTTGTTVPVPVEMPEGVKYETTVQE